LKEIRGKGLFIGMEFQKGSYAEKFAMVLLKHGLIAKPTQKNIIRFSPPLIITKSQINDALTIV